MASGWLARQWRCTLEGKLFLPHGHTVSVDPNTRFVYFPLENLNGHPVLRIMAPIPSPSPSAH